jgi:hypothetical protein
MRRSILDAIREGDWHFEPAGVDPNRYEPTRAIPGTREKLAVLAERVRAGLPLWHEADRPDYEELAEEGSRIGTYGGQSFRSSS